MLERPYPSVPGWSQLGGDLVDTSTSWTMPLHLRVNAEYMLRACNQLGCGESAPVQVGPAVDEAIGYFKASNAESGDYFGSYLAISADGTTMVVSAYSEDSGAQGVGGDQSDNFTPKSGAAYVFVREGDTWTQQAYLKASNTDQDDSFGVVAISGNGDTIAVGAYYEDGVLNDPTINGATDSGAVYVFQREAGEWSQEAYLKALNNLPLTAFGSTLALSADGNTLAVGVEDEDSSAIGINQNPWLGTAENSGAVYVYSREYGEWGHRAYLKASNADEGDRFGAAVALSADGNTLAVGATLEESQFPGIDGDQSDDSFYSGAAYVFTRRDDSWTQQAYIKASNPGQQDHFGYAIALSLDGDTLAVGAPFERSAATEIDGDQSNDEAFGAGAVYVFSRSNQTWQQDAYLKAPNAESSDVFGISLALSGDGGVLVAAAQGEQSGDAGCFADPTDNSKDKSGAAYVFTRVTGTWTHRSYLKAPNSNSDYRFGGQVGLTVDGGTLVIGASGDRSTATGIGGNQNNMAGSDVGAVYMY